MIKNIAVYLGATMPQNPIYTQAVAELGEKLAANNITLVFGGSREGTMTILADAVLSHGGRAVGIFTKSLPQDLLYPGLTETIITENLAERKATMLERADAVIALPGSFGTWDELFDALEASKIAMINNRPPKRIGILNLNGVYDGIAQLLAISVQEGFTSRKYANLLCVENSVDEILDKLLRD